MQTLRLRNILGQGDDAIVALSICKESVSNEQMLLDTTSADPVPLISIYGLIFALDCVRGAENAR